MSGNRGSKAAALSMLALLSASTWAQSSPEDARQSERIRSTYEAVSPGTPASNGSSRRQLKIEPVAQEATGTQDDQPQIRRNSEAMPRTCKMLQAEIDHKISANDVVDYTVKVVPAAEAEEIVARNRDEKGKVEIVGHCGQGSYKIVYRRG